jgi:hypothetical protein
MAISVLEERPEYRLGHVGSVYVTVWFSELNDAALDALAKHQRDLVAKYGKITMVSVVVNATKGPGPELRERLRAQSAELAEHRLGNIIVVMARGMSAIIARTFLAMLSLISKEHMKVPASLEAAAEEVKKIPGQDAATLANLTLAEDLVAFANLPSPLAGRGSG